MHANTSTEQSGEFLGKKSRIIKRSICTSETSDLKTRGRTGLIGLYGEVKIILKR